MIHWWEGGNFYQNLSHCIKYDTKKYLITGDEFPKNFFFTVPSLDIFYLLFETKKIFIEKLKSRYLKG